MNTALIVNADLRAMSYWYNRRATGKMLAAWLAWRFA